MKLLQIKNRFYLKLLAVFLLFGVLYGCQKADRLSELSSPTATQEKAGRASPNVTQESADFVHEWFRLMARIQMPASISPVFNYRNYGFIGVGLFESVQPGIKGGSSFSPKLYQMPAMPKPDMSQDYLWSASANAALASMFKLILTGLTDANRASIDSMEAAQYNRFLLTTPEDVLQRSQAFGRSIATAIYNWSTTDGFTLASDDYVLLNEPWAWVPTSFTPQGAPIIQGAHIGESRPFLKYSLDALAPPIPVPYSEDPSSQFYLAVKEVYDIGNHIKQNPGSEQEAIARWWADAFGPGLSLTAPYHLVSIVTGVLESHNAGLWKAAEVYAKTAIATKDGPIITFRSKYHYNLLRPITYINRHIDPEKDWSSLLPSPPYPDYTSGLVSNYGPAMQVLITEFGDIPVTDNAYGWRGMPARQYSSLSQLRQEAADSRVYAGIHYRFTQNTTVAMGIELGNEIARVRVVGPEY